MASCIIAINLPALEREAQSSNSNGTHVRKDVTLADGTNIDLHFSFMDTLQEESIMVIHPPFASLAPFEPHGLGYAMAYEPIREPR